MLADHCSFDADADVDSPGPTTKKRKTASVLVNQPSNPDKMVIDQVTDVMATFEEVQYVLPIVSKKKSPQFSLHYITEFLLFSVRETSYWSRVSVHTQVENHG